MEPVVRGVGEGGEDDDFTVALVDGLAVLVRNDFAQGGQLGIPFRADLAGSGE